MDRTEHTLLSVKVSALAGMLFAVLSGIPDPSLYPFLFPMLIVGVVIGFVLSPAAVWARADPECRPSFAWVVAPTAALTFLASAGWRDMWLAFLVSVATYLVTCLIVGLVAVPRRRRLNWYIDGRCTVCGYDVRGLEGPKCPECGEIARVRPRVRVPLDVLRE